MRRFFKVCSMSDWKTALFGLLALLLLVPAGCLSKSSLSKDEAVRRAQACITADASTSYLPVARSDFEACLERAMREPAGRRFLLDAGNQAVAGWSFDMTRFLSEDLGLHPTMGLRRAVIGLGAVPEGGGTGRRVGRFYEQLVTAVFANVKNRRNASAEVAGSMYSFIAQGPDKPVDPFVRYARERIPDGDEGEVTTQLSSLISAAMADLVAIAFWADDRLRSGLLAGDPPVSPAVPPPVTTPPLEDPPGRLHIPSPDQQPAHDLFWNWYEHGGGQPLATAAMAAIERSGIAERFLD
jgi:hypothetical protein